MPIVYPSTLVSNSLVKLVTTLRNEPDKTIATTDTTEHLHTHEFQQLANWFTSIFYVTLRESFPPQQEQQEQDPNQN